MPYLKILRPVNVIFVSITILFGALFRNPVSFNLNILFAIISASLISAAGYVINDFFDLKIDLFNRPDRPIPSGKIKPRVAYIYSVFLFVLGITLSFFTANLICVFLAIINSILLFDYAKNLKKKLLIGNLLVSYAAGSCFVYGGVVADNFDRIIYIAIFAFLFTFIRELVKDVEDIEGDREFGVRSLALLYGKKPVLLLTAIVVFLITLFYLYLYYISYFRALTMILSFVLIILPLIIMLFYLKANIDSKTAFSKSSSLLKIEMLILLIIVLIGR
jgi:geranylgeranylglycerol-phosphate geranylgeranyltransferase